MLNWRRDPGYEQRMLNYGQQILHYEQRKKETKQIEKEIEQLDLENARLENLLSCVDRLCFPPEFSSIPQPSTKND
jgi:cell shape-determining protein MreC